MPKKITPRQLRFVLAFVNQPDATRAAIEAGYSRKNASSIGYQLLQKTPVAEEVRWRFQLIAERVHVTKEEVVAGVLREAYNFSDGSSSEARSNAWAKIARILGMDRFTVTVEQAGGPPAHAAPEIRELLSALPEEKLQQFQEIMGLLEAAGKAKLIEHEPTQPRAD
jgi:hypothetical protein